MDKITPRDMIDKGIGYSPEEHIKGITIDTAKTLREWISQRGYKDGDADRMWLFAHFATECQFCEFVRWCARRINPDWAASTAAERKAQIHKIKAILDRDGKKATA